MATGDLQGHLAGLQRALQAIKCPCHVDVAGLRLGEPLAALPLLHYVLLGFSGFVRAHAHACNIQLAAKTDQGFVEAALRLAKDHMGITTRLTPATFLAPGYAELRIMLLQEVAAAARRIAADGARRARTQRQQAARPAAGQLERVPRPTEVRVECMGREVAFLMKQRPLPTATDAAQSQYAPECCVDVPSGNGSGSRSIGAAAAGLLVAGVGRPIETGGSGDGGGGLNERGLPPPTQRRDAAASPDQLSRCQGAVAPRAASAAAAAMGSPVIKPKPKPPFVLTSTGGGTEVQSSSGLPLRGESSSLPTGPAAFWAEPQQSPHSAELPWRQALSPDAEGSTSLQLPGADVWAPAAGGAGLGEGGSSSPGGSDSSSNDSDSGGQFWGPGESGSPAAGGQEMQPAAAPAIDSGGESGSPWWQCERGGGLQAAAREREGRPPPSKDLPDLQVLAEALSQRVAETEAQLAAEREEARRQRAALQARVSLLEVRLQFAESRLQSSAAAGDGNPSAILGRDPTGGGDAKPPGVCGGFLQALMRDAAAASAEHGGPAAFADAGRAAVGGSSGERSAAGVNRCALSDGELQRTNMRRATGVAGGLAGSFVGDGVGSGGVGSGGVGCGGTGSGGTGVCGAGSVCGSSKGKPHEMAERLAARHAEAQALLQQTLERRRQAGGGAEQRQRSSGV